MSDRERPLHGFSLAHHHHQPLNSSFNSTFASSGKTSNNTNTTTNHHLADTLTASGVIPPSTSTSTSVAQQHIPHQRSQQQLHQQFDLTSQQPQPNSMSGASDQSNLPSSNTNNIASTRHNSSSKTHNNINNNSDIMKPSTPLGKVVDAGQEHTGRWTKEEHEAFLKGLQQYGKEWKKVAAKVKTRTVVQTRTHAQKYFQKLQKGLTGDKIELDLSIIESKKSSAKKRSARQRQQNQQQQHQQLQQEHQHQQEQTRKNHQQQSQLNNQQHSHQNHQSNNPKQPLNPNVPNINSGLSKSTQKRQAAIAMSNHAAAQLMAMSRVKPHPQSNDLSVATKPPPPSSAFFTSHQSILPPPHQQHPQHPQHQQHFSKLPQNFPQLTIPNHRQQIQLGPMGATNFGRVSFNPPMSQPISQTMKIIPPKPTQTMKKNLFPEPSPAACGSRKVIELAAAKMLAAVGNNAMNNNNNININNNHHKNNHGIKQPNDDFSGKATPPPPNAILRENGNRIDNVMAAASGLKRPAAGPLPGRLQIVNPDVLGIHNDNNNKRRNTGEEPTTPWDGQLEALGSEVKNKDKETMGAINDAMADPGENSDEAPFDYHPLHQSLTCNRSAIHVAVCGGSLQEVKHLINTSFPEMTTSVTKHESKIKALNEMDNDGFCPMHSAVSLSPSNMAVVMTHLLLSFGADATIVDKFGNTPLHWAARAGNDELTQVLLLKNCHPNVQNNQGETALHWAMRAGKLGHSVVRVLLENGARASLFSNNFQRPIDVAANGFEAVCLSEDVVESTTDERAMDKDDECTENIEEIRHSRMNLFCFSPQSRTLVLHHPECLEHVPKSETDWEAPGRVNSIINSIGSNVREYEVQISKDFDKASLELLSRVHSAEYLTFVNDLSKELEKRKLEQSNEENGGNKTANSVVPFTPMVQRTMRRETDVKKGSHSDTSFSSGSLKAARRAAGAVQHAVDCVLVGRNRNAFCVVRPPGHHAGINGLLDGGESCGFCIFNNVAAGAMHALSDEGQRPKCERCAIVDIDAHHGNGTEEIVKKCDDPGRLFFFSVHLFDNDKRKGKQNAFKYYPGTGDEDDVAHNIVNVPIAPMWREKEMSQLAKASQFNYGEGRNTRHKAKLKAAAEMAAKEDNSSGSEVNGDKTMNEINEKSPRLTPRSAPPHYYQGTGREAYRRAIQQRLLPALRAFNPDLILISMGFDASKGDVGNARHYAGGKEAEGINLEPEDYAWTTSKILEVADICCQGKVVSVLEGGYGRSPSNGNESKTSKENQEGNMLDKTIFAECAIRHLRAMIDPFDEEKLH